MIWVHFVFPLKPSFVNKSFLPVAPTVLIGANIASQKLVSAALEPVVPSHDS